MLSNLDDHVAFVTGASRGIGRATAVALAREGCDLALASRSPGALEATASQCREHGAEALTIETDVRDREGVQASIEYAVEQLGGLEILVNNAGTSVSEPIDRANLDDWEATIETNVLGAMYATRFAAPHLKMSRADGQRSAIVNIASVAGEMSFPGGGAYCASKHGLVGLSGSMFEDLREEGIKVTAIKPGFVDTEFVEGEGLNREKMIQPEDVAETAIFVVKHPETACPTEILLRPQRTPYVDE
jgi:NADP-dependent 3-hydroxy acid dehydrogenase YdfG